MIIHPLFKAIVSRPELLAEHAGAYVELAGAELTAAATQLRTRALLVAAAAACGGVGLLLAGTALLLLAVLPAAQMPAPWALAAVPGAVWLAAAVLWGLQARASTGTAFDALRAQVALDRDLLRAAGEQA